jgi:hypothetical protein
LQKRDASKSAGGRLHVITYGIRHDQVVRANVACLSPPGHASGSAVSRMQPQHEPSLKHQRPAIAQEESPKSAVHGYSNAATIELEWVCFLLIPNCGSISRMSPSLTFNIGASSLIRISESAPSLVHFGADFVCV